MSERLFQGGGEVVEIPTTLDQIWNAGKLCKRGASECYPRAMKRPTAPSPRAPASTGITVPRMFGCFGALFIAFWPLVFAPVMVIAVGPMMAPSIGRLPAPIVCPSGYTRSTVKTWSTTHDADESSDHWELECVSADGSVRAAPDVATRLVLFAITDALVIAGLGLLVGTVYIRARADRRRASAARLT